MKIFAFLLLVMVISGCIGQTSAPAATAAPILTLPVWYVAALGEDTKDLEITPMADFSLNLSASHASNYHLVWNGSYENNNPLIAMAPPISQDPACPVGFVGFRVNLSQNGKLLFSGKLPGVRCDPTSAWVIVIAGGHLRSERGGYSDVPFRLDAKEHHYTCPRGTMPPFSQDKCGEAP